MKIKSPIIIYTNPCWARFLSLWTSCNIYLGTWKRSSFYTYGRPFLLHFETVWIIYNCLLVLWTKFIMKIHNNIISEVACYGGYVPTWFISVSLIYAIWKILRIKYYDVKVLQTNIVVSFLYISTLYERFSRSCTQYFIMFVMLAKSIIFFLSAIHKSVPITNNQTFPIFMFLINQLKIVVINGVEHCRINLIR